MININRDQLVAKIIKVRSIYTPCKDDRNRDALDRMVQDFQNLAACHPSNVTVHGAYYETIRAMNRQWEYDLRHTCTACETVGAH